MVISFTAAEAQTVRKTFNPDKCYKCESGVFYKLFHIRYCQKCDQVTPPEPPETVQALDADTLFFHNETELRDWCTYHGLGSWTVQPPKFNYYEQMSDVVPYVWGKGCTMRQELGLGNDSMFFIPDANYYMVPEGCRGTSCIADNMQFLHEEMYSGKKYVSFRDHSHLQKEQREMSKCFCSEGDLFNVRETVKNPFTGQVVVFYDIYRWSDRNGENIWNENLKLYTVWPELANYRTVEFELDTYDPETECDYTFREYFPGHETMTLYFQGQKNGVTMTIAEVYGAELGR